MANLPAKIDERSERSRKAAVLITSLERPYAVKILRAMDPESMTLITEQILRLGEIPEDERDQVFAEFATALGQSTCTGLRGGTEVARALLNEAIGDAKTKEILGANKHQAFSSIANVNEVDLAGFLSKEQPAVAAMILACFPAKKTAEILANMEPDVRAMIVSRLTNSSEPDPEVIQRIETVFVKKVTSMVHTTRVGDTNSSLGGAEFLANIFQNINRELEEELFSVVKETSEESADKIRDLMFTFNDVVRLSDVDVQKVVRQFPMDKLVIALRGTPPAVQNKVSQNLSKHAQETLKEEMELLGKVKRTDVEEQQRSMVNIIRNMEAAGEISLRQADQDDVYV